MIVEEMRERWNYHDSAFPDTRKLFNRAELHELAQRIDEARPPHKPKKGKHLD